MLTNRNEAIINITSKSISGFRDFNNVALSSKLKHAYLSCDIDLAVKAVDEWVLQYTVKPLKSDLSLSVEQRSNILKDSKLMFNFIVEQESSYFCNLVSKLKDLGYVPVILDINNKVVSI